MNNAVNLRSKLEIVTEMLELTRRMLEKREDADFLIESIDKRQEFMDEYDQLTVSAGGDLTAKEQDEIKRMIQEIIILDKTVNSALNRHMIVSKDALANSNNQKKVLAYTNSALSSSGSYMDYKK